MVARRSHSRGRDTEEHSKSRKQPARSSSRKRVPKTQVSEEANEQPTKGLKVDESAFKSKKAAADYGVHFADWIMSDAPKVLTVKTTEDILIRTTFDPEVQAHIDKTVSTIFKSKVRSGSKAEIAVVVMSASGDVIAMLGGRKALQPLKEPITLKLQEIIVEMKEAKSLETGEKNLTSSLLTQVEQMIDQRLDELTPGQVKNIIQAMIREHLGWLVVWGGAVGGLIGFGAAIV